jgi:hypothetical protein
MDTELVQKVFDYFSKNYQANIVLAGGAPRDFILGKGISDYDFYVGCSMSPREVAKFADRMDINKRHCYRIGESTGQEYTGMGAVWQVGNDIQLITDSEYVDTQRVWERFDIGLCMAAIESDGTLVTAPAFDVDRDNKQLTLYITNKNIERTGRSLTAHVPKLLKKYPDYKLKIQEDMDHWELRQDALLGESLESLLPVLKKVHDPSGFTKLLSNPLKGRPR